MMSAFLAAALGASSEDVYDLLLSGSPARGQEREAPHKAAKSATSNRDLYELQKKLPGAQLHDRVA